VSRAAVRVTSRQLLVAVLAAWLASGCATIIRGTEQTIHFDCNPPGAKLEHLRTGETWTLPADVTLPRRSRHELLATLDGYQPAMVHIRSEIPFYWWLADAFTLGIGTIVDAIAGGFYDLKPERVSLVLEPAPEPPQP
jgi:hypothetical protein